MTNNKLGLQRRAGSAFCRRALLFEGIRDRPELEFCTAWSKKFAGCAI